MVAKRKNKLDEPVECCGVDAEYRVMSATSGYFVGSWCEVCDQPCNRESLYYSEKRACELALENSDWVPR